MVKGPPVDGHQSSVLFPHTEARTFRDAIQFTAAQTGFPPALIEKDYFCSLILREIYRANAHGLVFKGGTSLNKVHAGFYRLSEDLDFSISISSGANRAGRKATIAPVKDLLNQVVGVVAGVALKRGLVGSNQSMQYNSDLEYQSCVSPTSGFIRLEVGLREEVLRAVVASEAQTMVRDPFLDRPLVGSFEVRVLNIQEAYAEKMRAALSRNTPAIRDLFDIDFAMRAKTLDFLDPGFQGLVMKKLTVPGNGEVRLDDARKALLLQQVEAELRPVLRPEDFEKFDFQKAWSTLVALGAKMVKE